MTVKVYTSDPFGVYTESGTIFDDRFGFNPPTDIVLFVGVSNKTGPSLNSVIEVTDTASFVASVGTAAEAPELYYGVREFFRNGGREAHVIITKKTDTPLKADFFNDTADDAILRDLDAAILCVPKGVGARELVDTGYSSDYQEIDQHYIDLVDTVDLGRLFYVFGVPVGTSIGDAVQFMNGVARTSRQAAAYFNCPTVESGVTAGGTVSVDVAPLACAIWAKVAREAVEGVAKAPAGNNSAWLVRGVLGVEQQLINADKVNLQAAHINYLLDESRRQFFWGASTLNTDAYFRMVNVARLHSYVRQKLNVGLQPFVFEGINAYTLQNMESAGRNMLAGMKDRRMFALFKDDGTPASETELFSIRATQDSSNKNQVNVAVGIAPVRPAEFIVATITLIKQ